MFFVQIFLCGLLLSLIQQVSLLLSVCEALVAACIATQICIRVQHLYTCEIMLVAIFSFFVSRLYSGRQNFLKEFVDVYRNGIAVQIHLRAANTELICYNKWDS